MRGRAILAGLLLVASLPVVVSSAAAATSACMDGGGLPTYTYVGPDGGSWSRAANWDLHDRVPGEGSKEHVLACVPAGLTVVVGDGIEIHVDALDVEGHADIVDGGKLFVEGGAGVPSSVAASIHVMRGILGGKGTLTISGTLTVTSLVTGASTLSTRDIPDIVGLAPDPGTIVIEPGASLDIDDRGINFLDQLEIDSFGTTTISNDGYIAADYGTRFLNRLGAHFLIANDGGYYQGDARDMLELSNLINTGEIRKTAGTGTSVIDAHFSNTDGIDFGTVVVESGSLSIFGADVVATVDPGASVATGACGAQVVCTSPAATPDDVEIGRLTTPVIAGALPAELSISELGGANGAPYPPGKKPRGHEFEVDSGVATATSAKPLAFVLRLDAIRVLPGEDLTKLAVGRGGTVMRPCAGATARPNPCFVPPTALEADGDLSITILGTSFVNSLFTILGPRFR